ncbi:ThiF family adenylyltransferase [Ensifer aridi]|uniref:ThiF family adenylyltransferase n=1 Tax=Ensifer aridi TaxID=1708715 RepID=UPI000A103CF5|nr:ThiF family adenylyltransferase [Ensifer aridi]
MKPYTDFQPPAAFAGTLAGRRRLAELEKLHSVAGESLLIDEEAAAAGILRIEFSWPLNDGRTIGLKAVYPDTFPRLRPHVFLTCDPSEYPERHCGPEGALCLLGRDTRYWQANMSLADILDENLAHVLNGTGAEDPQGEPIEYWWNSLGQASGSFILVDSGWKLSGYDKGTVDVLVTVSRKEIGRTIRAAILTVHAGDGSLLAKRVAPLPAASSSTAIRASFPWRRDDQLSLPTGSAEVAKVAYGKTYVTCDGADIRLSFTVSKTELQHNEHGDAWVCAMAVQERISGPSRRGPRRRDTVASIVPVLRDGEIDIGYRVPSVASLRGKRIAVVGLGALGSPAAVELARNGCTSLHLMDDDVVEPGNAIRWELGASSWGTKKTDTLKRFIERESPWTSVLAVPHRIGLPTCDPHTPGDTDRLNELLDSVDLVVDASAAPGVTYLLGDICRERGLPLISVFASPNLHGGAVVFHHPESGCPVCRAHANETPEGKSGHIPYPNGMNDESTLVQPPGCSELTFTGASFDLKELSLETVRMAVDVLSSPDEWTVSEVRTVNLHNGKRRVPPNWRIDPLERHPDCGCRS